MPLQWVLGILQVFLWGSAVEIWRPMEELCPCVLPTSHLTMCTLWIWTLTVMKKELSARKKPHMGQMTIQFFPMDFNFWIGVSRKELEKIHLSDPWPCPAPHYTFTLIPKCILYYCRFQGGRMVLVNFWKPFMGILEIFRNWICIKSGCFNQD